MGGSEKGVYEAESGNEYCGYCGLGEYGGQGG